MLFWRSEASFTFYTLLVCFCLIPEMVSQLFGSKPLERCQPISHYIQENVDECQVVPISIDFTTEAQCTVLREIYQPKVKFDLLRRGAMISLLLDKNQLQT